MKLRARAGSINGPNLTLLECSEIYMARKRERGYARRKSSKWKQHKPRSIDYRQETLDAIRKWWSGFDATVSRTVGERQCHDFADTVRKHYSPSRYNGIIQTLRGILEIAVEFGCLESNPARAIGFAEIPIKQKFVPERNQFTEILRQLDSLPSRKFARLSIRAMAFTGLRPNEGANVELADVNLTIGKLTARETKNGKPRTIQLIPQAVDLFEQEGIAEVLAALRKSPRKALNTICREMNLPRLTPYTMRYLHLTALIESGVDIGVAADIAGHQDGGVTLLRNYRQTRGEHLKRQIKKVFI